MLVMLRLYALFIFFLEVRREVGQTFCVSFGACFFFHFTGIVITWILPNKSPEPSVSNLSWPVGSSVMKSRRIIMKK